MYLLRNDGRKKHRGLDGFFDMDGNDYKKRVKYMSMEQFLLLGEHITNNGRDHPSGFVMYGSVSET